MNTELTPKQQTSEAIRAAETILVTSGAHPTVDQVAAVIGLTQILRRFGKKATAVISDQLPPQVSFLATGELDRSPSGSRDFILKVDLSKAEVDKLKYDVTGGKLNIHITPFKGSFAPSDVTFDYGDFHYDLVVVLGVPTRTKIDGAAKSFANVPIVNIDFHRSNELYGAINLIEANAASLCEILVSLSESLQNGLIDDTIATTLLTGIMASTDRFTAQHTTPKALTVAAQLMAAGAKQQAVVKGLYRAGRTERRSDDGGRRAEGRTESKAAESDPSTVDRLPSSDTDQGAVLGPQFSEDEVELPPVEELLEPNVEQDLSIEPSEEL